jgi:hypothetical protein
MNNSRNKIKLKPMKNVDSVSRTLHIRAFCIPFPLLGIVGFIFGGITGLFLAAVLCSLISLFTVFVSEGLGGIAGGLYGGHKPIWSIHERYSADFSRARVQKMNKKFDESLLIIDKVLIEQPDFNEALFLRAQILEEGFNDIYDAKKCLTRIFQTEPKHSQLFRWSESMYRSMIGRVIAEEASKVENHGIKS